MMPLGHSGELNLTLPLTFIQYDVRIHETDTVLDVGVQHLSLFQLKLMPWCGS